MVNMPFDGGIIVVEISLKFILISSRLLPKEIPQEKKFAVYPYVSIRKLVLFKILETMF